VNDLLMGMDVKGWKIKFDNFEFANAAEDDINQKKLT
jgi:hypothetical protein